MVSAFKLINFPARRMIPVFGGDADVDQPSFDSDAAS